MDNRKNRPGRDDDDDDRPLTCRLSRGSDKHQISNLLFVSSFSVFFLTPRHAIQSLALKQSLRAIDYLYR